MDPDTLQNHRQEKLKHARWQPLQGEAKEKSSSSDPYAILGVCHTAEFAEIRAKYLSLAQQFHPDKGALAQLLNHIWSEESCCSCERGYTHACTHRRKQGRVPACEGGIRGSVPYPVMRCCALSLRTLFGSHVRVDHFLALARFWHTELPRENLCLHLCVFF